MNAVFAIAQSGLATATLRLNAAAHNLANLGTEGYNRQVVQQVGRADGGVEGRVVAAPAGPAGGLVEDIVELKLASYAFRANLLSLQRADDTLGRLLDRRA